MTARMSKPCKAVKFNGEPCKNPAVPGLEVCRYHGGSTPLAKAKAKRYLVQREIEQEFSKLKVTPIGDPTEAFATLTAEVVAVKDWMAVRVANLKAEFDNNARTNGNELRYSGAAGEQLRAEVALYERAMDRAGKFLTSWIQHGFDERRVQIDEARVAIMEQLIRAFIDDEELGLDDRQRKVAPAVFAKHVRLLDDAA